jgi:hypothetical protein
VRDVTDDEVRFYHENGWAKLDGLVEPEVSAEMLRVARPQYEEKRVAAADIWELALGYASEGVEPFRSVALSETMGRNAQRLIDRRRLTDTDVPVRFRLDLVARKDVDARGTPYHHDGHGAVPDRSGMITFWVALEEVTPEMGSMRFLSGSHREGPLGLDFANQNLTDIYPKLVDLYELSPPLHYRPGDATVHHSWTVHGTPPNVSGRPRWSYVFGYASADTLWTLGELTPLDDENSTLVTAIYESED